MQLCSKFAEIDDLTVPDKIYLVECPRDAMQGWNKPIATSKKVEYINALLQVGFDTLDMGSFVSPRAIPQMADTGEVIKKLDWQDTGTKLLVIVANVQGAEEAARYDEISSLGYPFSISETFQQRNANSTIAASYERLESIAGICNKGQKELVVYLSMAFGNPYGDTYSEEIVSAWAERITYLGVRVISLADTVGLASPEQVGRITGSVLKLLPETEIGVHLHSTPECWQQKLDAALQAGCRRFDSALMGIGGCPMAGDALVGNMDSSLLIEYFKNLNLLKPLNEDALRRSLVLAEEIFQT
jgi:hydroxymethylglutaryl-CoA lyase